MQDLLKGMSSTCLPVFDDVAAGDVPKSAKHNLEVLIRRDWVELAHEQHVAWWLDVCIWQVTNHLQHHSTIGSLIGAIGRFHLIGIPRVILRRPVLLKPPRLCSKHRLWGAVGDVLLQACWVVKGVLQNRRVPDAVAQ